jgi:MFS family permease
VLRAQQSGVPLLIPLVMVAMNLLYFLSAYPFGKLSDAMSHTRLLQWGWWYNRSGYCAGVHDPLDRYYSGCCALGRAYGNDQGLLAAMIAKTAPADLRGTAYGIFSMISGVGLLIASVVAGFIWETWGAEYTFYTGAVICLLTLCYLIRMPDEVQ